MMSDWGAILQQSGAVVEGGVALHFGHPERERQTAGGEIIADLSHHGLLRIAGDDAVTFLQGQLTQDVRQVSAERSLLAAACTPKGRALAVMRLFERDGALYARLPAAVAESLINRLRKYVLRAKVTLDAAPLIGLGLSGTEAAGWLADQLGGPLPETVGAGATVRDVTVVRVPGAAPRFEAFGPLLAMEAIWRSRPGWLHPVGSPVWELLDLRAGLPEVYPATSEAFVPQMLNLGLLDGISFTKGCYTGQEIVARMHYLGKLKRRMYLAHTAADTPPAPGTELFAVGSESGQGPGEVVAAQRAEDGGVLLLAVIERAAVDANQEVRLYNQQGPALSIRALPYPFPNDD